MEYIVYEKITNQFFGEKIIRTELKNEKQLKDYLFKNKHNLDNIEIFEAGSKAKTEIKIDIKVEK